MKRMKANEFVSEEVPAASNESPRRIFIVAECPTFREGLTQILNFAGDLMVCGAAGAVDQALTAIARTKPDLVLADLDFPRKRGLELIKALRSVDRSVKLLTISTHNEAPHVARVFRAGGDGYIGKQENPDEIVSAIHDCLEGQMYVSEKVMESQQAAGRNRNPMRRLGRRSIQRIPTLRSWSWLATARADAKKLTNARN